MVCVLENSNVGGTVWGSERVGMELELELEQSNLLTVLELFTNLLYVNPCHRA